MTTTATQLAAALRELEASYERIKPPGCPLSDYQKRARQALAAFEAQAAEPKQEPLPVAEKFGDLRHYLNEAHQFAAMSPRGRDCIGIALDMVDELETLYAAPVAQAEPAWLPILTAPKDGSLFLCWVSAVSYGETDEGQQYGVDVSQVDFCQWQSFDEAPDGGWFEPCCGQVSEHQRVTHWMPLPQPPKENPNG